MARRGENIYKRKDGRWEGRFIAGRKPDGKARYKSVYGASYHVVKKKLEAVKAELSAQKKTGCRLTLSTLCLQWLEMVRHTVKESSYVRYALLVQKHIIPVLGQMRIDKLTANHLTRFMNDKLEKGRMDGKGGLSPKTVQDIMIILKAVLRAAGHEMPACVDTLKLPKVIPPEIKVLGDGDIQALERAVKQETSNTNLGFLLSLYSGVRLGELCAIRWSDIDWTDNTLSIRKTVLRLPRQGDSSEAKTRLTITRPKTKNAERVIPLPVCLIGLLRKCAVTQEKDAYILTGLTTRFMDPRTYQYQFKRFLDKHHITCVNFHALRHTFATQCVRRGVDIKTLSEILGHSTVQMTLDRYVHSSIEIKRSQIEKLSYLVA